MHACSWALTECVLTAQPGCVQSAAEFNFSFVFSVGAHGGCCIWCCVLVFPFCFYTEANATSSLRYIQPQVNWKLRRFLVERWMRWDEKLKSCQCVCVCVCFQHARMSNEWRVCETCCCCCYLPASTLERTQRNGIFLTICSGIYLQRPHRDRSETMQEKSHICDATENATTTNDWAMHVSSTLYEAVPENAIVW